jgi:hypothetical protein
MPNYIFVVDSIKYSTSSLDDISDIPVGVQPEIIQCIADQDYEVIPDPEPIDETPPPNWDGFNLAFSTLPSLLQAELIANQNHPSIVGKKDLAYSMISDHGVGAFSLIFPLFCQAGGVDNDTRIEWAELAMSFNMPADFVSVIRG